MINAAREILVRNLRANAALFTEVSGRIYFAHLATLTNPTYPCITIQFTGGSLSAYGYNPDLSDSGITVQYHSSKSFNDVWNMYEKAKTVLAFGTFSDDEVTLRVTEEGVPFERYDTEARVYTLTNNWNVFMIGA